MGALVKLPQWPRETRLSLPVRLQLLTKDMGDKVPRRINLQAGSSTGPSCHFRLRGTGDRSAQLAAGASIWFRRRAQNSGRWNSIGIEIVHRL